MLSPFLETTGGQHCGHPIENLHVLRDDRGMAFRTTPDGGRELVYGCAVCGRAWSVIQSPAEVKALRDRVIASLQAQRPPQGRAER